MDSMALSMLARYGCGEMWEFEGPEETFRSRISEAILSHHAEIETANLAQSQQGKLLFCICQLFEGSLMRETIYSKPHPLLLVLDDIPQPERSSTMRFITGAYKQNIRTKMLGRKRLSFWCLPALCVNTAGWNRRYIYFVTAIPWQSTEIGGVKALRQNLRLGVWKRWLKRWGYTTCPELLSNKHQNLFIR